jgi:hypothetical protein
LRRLSRDLDAAKVHVAILGDYRHDPGLLTRRSEDRPFLRDLSCAINSDRYLFDRAQVVDAAVGPNTNGG